MGNILVPQWFDFGQKRFRSCSIGQMIDVIGRSLIVYTYKLEPQAHGHCVGLDPRYSKCALDSLNATITSDSCKKNLVFLQQTQSSVSHLWTIAILSLFRSTTTHTVAMNGLFCAGGALESLCIHHRERL